MRVGRDNRSLPIYTTMPHHRYYGSSAEKGGERIAESRRGKRPRSPNVCGF
ncbi:MULTISPECIES: hypothetical protein [unclassified Bradyrhizobium]|uniref:hypothetical protein n=1 Tax=unclassified Bradyrhizobium TaxID=2631580 RepID=UPI001FFB0191|nr:MULTISPECIES: hypothetical protein [unclassified Bradyrhizobium]